MSMKPEIYKDSQKGREHLIKLVSQNRIRDAKSTNKLAFLNSRLRAEGRSPRRAPRICSVLECYVKKEGECDDCTMMDGYAHTLSNAQYAMSIGFSNGDVSPRPGLKKQSAAPQIETMNMETQDSMDLD